MKLANSADNYGLISKLFHWIMAALIIATYILGKNLENNFEYYYEILMIHNTLCLLYTSPSPRDKRQSRMPSSA